MVYVIIVLVLIIVVAGIVMFGKGDKDSDNAEVDNNSGRTGRISRSVPDDREARLDDSAVKLRTIILTLADALHGVDASTMESSGNLSEARIRISNIKSSHYVKEAELLIDEIDNVISSNTSLRRKLSETQTTLEKQQEQIFDLRTAVRVDALTQLGNRAAFEERLADALGSFERYGEKFCLLMLDIDHFKNINDTHGHLSGDRVLKGLAIKVKQSLRSTDFAGRYGGEEFGIILPKIGLEEGREVAEKLRASVERSKFALDTMKLSVTISIGVSESAPGDTAEKIIGRSDVCLYKAKEEGRNRVIVADGGGESPQT